MTERPPLATASKRGSAQTDLRLLTFKLGDSVYGIDIEDVHAIYHALPLIPDLNEQSRVQGYLLLSNRRMPVISLSRNGGTRTKLHLAEWVIAVGHHESQVGFIVDEVHEILKLPPTALHVADPAEMEQCGFQLKAVARTRDAEIPLPDLTRLVPETIK